MTVFDDADDPFARLRAPLPDDLPGTVLPGTGSEPAAQHAPGRGDRRDLRAVVPPERHRDDPGPIEPGPAGPGAGGLTQRDRVAIELERQRAQHEARRLLRAEDVPPLRVLGLWEFLDAPTPEPLVDGLLYRDSLARGYGAPGSGKSFAALDLALSVAIGRRWGERDVHAGPVVYTMAEGQRVNTERTTAWIDRHGVDPAKLAGRFYAVPDAVMLTEEGVAPLAAMVAEVGAVLVIIDTKNACMVGDESSASDFAVMRRALDVLRKASGACVLLIDHTGHENEKRARGSSAGTAAMDTEFSVTTDGGSPQRITVRVTRDKAAEAGASWSFHLRMHDPAAVLIPADDVPDRAEQEPKRPAWETAGAVLPPDLIDYEGPGAKGMPALARLMANDASPARGDPNGVGVSRLEATKAVLAATEVDEATVRRAWSALLDLDHIKPAKGVTSATGRHIWTR